MSHLLLSKALLLKVKRQGLASVKYPRPIVTMLAWSLTHIEIEECSRHHHRRVTLACRFTAGGNILPAIDLRLVAHIARIDSLVPDAGLFAIFLYDLCHAIHEVSLQLLALSHAMLCHQSLAVGTLHPLSCRDLIATDMDM